MKSPNGEEPFIVMKLYGTNGGPPWFVEFRGRLGSKQDAETLARNLLTREMLRGGAQARGFDEIRREVLKEAADRPPIPVTLPEEADVVTPAKEIDDMSYKIGWNQAYFAYMKWLKDQADSEADQEADEP